MLEWCKYSYEDKPSQYCFGNEAEDDVDPFTIEVIFPASDAFVLQYHVEGKDVEHNEVDEEYRIHECGRISAG